MTAYYVDSAGSNTSPYDTWAKAATSLSSAVTAATAAGDVIYVDQGFTETLAANTTYTFANHVGVICSNDKTNAPPQTLGVMGTSAWIGHTTTSYTITLNGAYKVYIYGVTFRTAGTSAAAQLILANSDGSHFEFESVYLWTGSTGNAHLTIGGTGSSVNSYCKFLNCTFRFGLTSQFTYANNNIDFIGCTISGDGSTPAILFGGIARGGIVNSIGCDWGLPGTALVNSQTGNTANFIFQNCKINASLSSVLATQTPANKGSANAWLFNCSSGDTHYHLQHHDSFGSTIIDTGIYANDGAQYDGTNYCSWKIVTTANCSYYTPYVSPWIDCYHSGTSAITPYLEILRDDSTTAYQDDEVWAEFSYQGTSGYPLASIVNDRKALLAAAADQTAGVGTSGWTGDTGAWSGKLSPTASITPAEIGHLRARVCVGEPSITVYVDPTIRGRS